MTCEFSGSVVCSAIKATFERRSTLIPSGVPVALTTEFSQDPVKITQWRAFIAGGSVRTTSLELSEVVARLGSFLLPPIRSISASRPFDSKWMPPGPWEP